MQSLSFIDGVRLAANKCHWREPQADRDKRCLYAYYAGKMLTIPSLGSHGRTTGPLVPGSPPQESANYAVPRDAATRTSNDLRGLTGAKR